jgi:hypothetical protein
MCRIRLQNNGKTNALSTLPGLCLPNQRRSFSIVLTFSLKAPSPTLRYPAVSVGFALSDLRPPRINNMDTSRANDDEDENTNKEG